MQSRKRFQGYLSSRAWTFARDLLAKPSVGIDRIPLLCAQSRDECHECRESHNQSPDVVEPRGRQENGVIRVIVGGTDEEEKGKRA